MQDDELHQWIGSALFLGEDKFPATNGWNPDTMGQVFLKLDELHIPLQTSLETNIIHAYRTIVEAAAHFLCMYPNAADTRELRECLFRDLGGAENLAERDGLKDHRRIIRIEADICLRLLAKLEEDLPPGQ